MTHAEVLIVGAGPAGIAAATAAARTSRSVLLLDDNHAPGGQIWRTDSLAPNPRDRHRDAALTSLQQSGAQLLFNTRVCDAPAPGILTTLSGEAITHIEYDKLILATGARERLLPFPGWTLPGVSGAGGLQALTKGGFPIAGKRVVVAGTGPLLIAVAAHLAAAHANIVCVAEQATLTQMAAFASAIASSPAKIWQGIKFRAQLRGAPYHTSTWPIAALGDTHLTSVRLTDGSRTWEEPCDYLACGFHLVPNTELASLLGCTFNGDFVAVDVLQRTSIGNIYCAGEPVAIGGLDAALIQGEIAGLAATDQLQQAQALHQRHATSLQRFVTRLEAAFRLRPELLTLAHPEDIVCRCEDVRFEQLVPYTSWTAAKLQTRCGMGPCQGRICGPATQSLFGWKPTSVRAPLSPVPVSAFIQFDLRTPTAPQEIP